MAAATEMGRKSESWWMRCGTSLSKSAKSDAARPLMNLPRSSVTDVGAITRRTGTRAIGSWARSGGSITKRMLRSRQQDTKRRSSELALHQHNIASGEQRAPARDRKSQAHAAALERNARLEQRGASLHIDARPGVMHLDGNFAASRRRHAEHHSARLHCLRGVLEQIRKHAL